LQPSRELAKSPERVDAPARQARVSAPAAPLRDAKATALLSGSRRAANWFFVYRNVLALDLVLAAGVTGFLVSPYAVAGLRLSLFLIGVTAYCATLLLVTTPGRFWAALTGLAALALPIVGLGLVSSRWATFRFPPLSAVVALFPRIQTTWLGALGAPDSGVHPNELAGVFLLLLQPLLGLFLFSAARSRPRGASRHSPSVVVYTIAAVSAAAMGLYLGLSFARGALLALLVALVCLCALRSRWLGAAVTLVCVAGAAAAVALLPPQFVSMLTFSDLSAPQWFALPTRFEIWRHGLELLRGSPWTGIGLGAFPYAFQERVADSPFQATALVPHAHNLYLQAALDLGLFGAAAYLALLVGAGVTAFQTGRRLGTGPAAGVAYGLTAGILAFGVYGLIDTITVTSRATVFIWLVMGLGATSARLLVGRARAD
jgi:putative inorganic carbon (HCO3(-)) transporter